MLFVQIFVNVCGKCDKKQMKFQYMENKLLEMEKKRMEMFLNYEDEEDDEEEYRGLEDEKQFRARKLKETPKNYLKKHYLYRIRGCYLLIKIVDVVRKKWLK